MSIPPNCSLVFAEQRRRLVGDVGLHEHGVAELLELLHRRGGAVLVDLGHDDLRALVEEALAYERPMPWPAPVTIATLSSSRPMFGIPPVGPPER